LVPFLFLSWFCDVFWQWEWIWVHGSMWSHFSFCEIEFEVHSRSISHAASKLWDSIQSCLMICFDGWLLSHVCLPKGKRGGGGLPNSRYSEHTYLGLGLPSKLQCMPESSRLPAFEREYN
jgi:hypothetical protein